MRHLFSAFLPTLLLAGVAFSARGQVQRAADPGLASEPAFSVNLVAPQFAGARAVQELNVAGEADDHPWLSADGLRLYYTKSGGPNSSLRYVAMASRSGLGQPFGPPVRVPGLRDNDWSAWLSDDELHVWYGVIGSGPHTIQHSTRASRQAPFSAPTPIMLLNRDTTAVVNVSGFCLSANGDELFVYRYNSRLSNFELQYATRTAPNVYTLGDLVPLPAWLSMRHAATLADHDRLLIISADSGNSGQDAFYALRRPAPGAPFGPPQRIGLPTPLAQKRAKAAFYRADLDLLACSAGLGYWTSHDLWLADHSSGVLGVAPTAPGAAFQLFPNPAHRTVRLTGASSGPVYVLDALGRVVLTSQAAAAAETTLDLSPLVPGLYTVRAGAATRRLVVE